MMDIGSTEFHIEVPNLSRDELERYSDTLFDIWEKQIPSTLALDDYSIILEIEEGSIKGNGKILAALAAVYGAIAGYGSFIQGLQIIHGQVVTVGNFLTTQAKSAFPDTGIRHSIKRKGGSLGQLQKLFYQVQHNEISVDHAMQAAKGILGEEADSVPEFMNRLHDSLATVPVDGSQISLISDDFDVGITFDSQPDSPSRKKRQSSPVSEKTILRIEIIRESKSSDKKKKISNR